MKMLFPGRIYDYQLIFRQKQSTVGKIYGFDKDAINKMYAKETQYKIEGGLFEIDFDESFNESFHPLKAAIILLRNTYCFVSLFCNCIL